MKPNMKKLAGIVFRSLFIGVGFITFGCCKQVYQKPPDNNGTVITEPAITVLYDHCDYCDYDQMYEHAIHLHGSGHFMESIRILEKLLVVDNRSDCRDNYHYWIGENHFGKQNYPQAISAFEKVLAFKQSNKNADALLMLGRCHMQLDKPREAINNFTKVLAGYPRSEAAGKTVSYLREVSASPYTLNHHHCHHLRELLLIQNAPVSTPNRSCVICTANLSTK